MDVGAKEVIFAVILIIFSLDFVTDAAHIPTPKEPVKATSTTKPENPPNKPCTESRHHFDAEGNVIYTNAHGTNCSGDDIHVKETEPSKIEKWKTNVIITCTVTAAIEVVIVVIIVLYWKQIRWSLRKIKCPCDESERNRRRSSQHVPMERSNNESRREARRNQSQDSRNNQQQTEQLNTSLINNANTENNHSSLFTDEEPGPSGQCSTGDIVEQTYRHSESNIPDSADSTHIETEPV